MQIHRLCIEIALLGVCQAAPAQAPLPGLAKDLARDKAFLPVYVNYLDAIHTRGMDGLKTLLAPDFAMKSDHETLTGAKAVTELKKYILDPKEDDLKLTTVTLRRLTFHGDRVTVQTQETCTFTPKEPSGSPKDPSETKITKLTVSWFWKQAWRKTPEGWRLTGWERGDETLPPTPVTLSYTLTWTPKSPAVSSKPPSTPQ